MSVRVFSWSLFMLMGAACTTRGPSPGAHAPAEAGAQHARHFRSIAQQDGSQLLLVLGERMDTLAQYHLVARGAVARTIPGAVLLQVPLKRVAVASTTHVPFLEALLATDALTGVAHAAQVRSPQVRARIEGGSVLEIGTAQGIDRERLMMLAPDALFTYPFGGGLDPIPGVTHIPVVQVAEYLEHDPLGRAEWLRFFGMLLDRSREADSLFEGIVQRYEAVRAAAPEGPRPKIFFGSSWQGEWSVPSGDSHMARLIADAGGEYLFAQQKAAGNIPMARERVIEQGMLADVWGRLLAQTPPVTVLDVAGGDERLLALPAFRQGRLFQCNSQEVDVFGQAALEPDVLLRDLRCILHPSACHGHAPIYFTPLAQ